MKNLANRQPGGVVGREGAGNNRQGKHDPEPDQSAGGGECQDGVIIEDDLKDQVGEHFADREGGQRSQKPGDKPDQGAFDQHDLHDRAVGGADGAHHADLAGALHHVQAHRAGQPDAADNSHQQRHDHQKCREDVQPFGSIVLDRRTGRTPR